MSLSIVLYIIRILFVFALLVGISFLYVKHDKKINSMARSIITNTINKTFKFIEDYSHILKNNKKGKLYLVKGKNNSN